MAMDLEKTAVCPCDGETRTWNECSDNTSGCEEKDIWGRLPPLGGKPSTNEDLVNSPSHYNHGDIECIDAIRAMLTPEEFRAYCRATSVKYIWRCEYKGHRDQDLEKAIWYLKRALDPT